MSPIQRVCICPQRGEPISPGEHTARCDREYRELFFATWRATRAQLAQALGYRYERREG